MIAPPPRFCTNCHEARVAWSMPRVDYCYSCLPGGPFTAPQCRLCGSDRYFSQGLCEICHPGSPKRPGSCKDCLAWGVLRAHNWRCWGCRNWRRQKPVAECPYCHRQMPLGDDGACRLCLQQARWLSPPGEPGDLVKANRAGQQLFLANLHYQPRRHRPAAPRPRRRPTTQAPQQTLSRSHDRPRAGFVPVRGRQLTLFRARPTLTTLHSLDPPPDSQMAEHLNAVLRAHAARHGWSKRLTNVVAASLRALQHWQGTPGAVIIASDARAQLAQNGTTTMESTLEVLAAAELLHDDTVQPARTYFLGRIAGLPLTMTAQLETWYTIMAKGSTTPPRRRPRDRQTIENHIRALSPILHAWAGAGHDNLAEITRVHVMAALPADRIPRRVAGAGLRSLFSVLKGRKEIFANPTAGVALGQLEANIPVPIDTAVIRDALNSPHPARALAVSLVAFHGLSAQQIRAIRLTDVADGRLTIGSRTIPLAGPVRVRLRVYLDYRGRRWPETSNPHLLINRRTAPRLTPVYTRYPWHALTIDSRSLREDRILHEVFASGGDVRRVCELFGLSVSAAMRYTLVLEHPDLTAGGPLSSRTQGSR